MPCRFPQASVESALKGLFPFSLRHAPIPVMEDLLVQLPLNLFLDFSEGEGLLSWQQQPPTITGDYRRAVTRCGAGLQAGHLFTGRDPGQNVSMRLDKKDNLAEALRASEGPAPLPPDAADCADPDLRMSSFRSGPSPCSGGQQGGSLEA